MQNTILYFHEDIMPSLPVTLQKQAMMYAPMDATCQSAIETYLFGQ